MTPPTESDAIVEYALRGTEQLELVAVTCRAYDQLCASVLSKFLVALKPVVGERLGPKWSVNIWPDVDDICKRRGIFLSAKRVDRSDDLRIDLEAEERRFPKRPYLAVRAVDGATFGTLTKADVFQSLNSSHRRGGTLPTTIWYGYFPPPFNFIGEVDDLRQLFEQSEWIDYYAREIEAVTQAVEQVLNICYTFK